MNSELDALFTVTSLVSLQGSSAASVLVPNVIGYLVGPSFDSPKKWVAFGIAMALALLVAILAIETSPIKWVVATFNGFLVFASAVGINEGFSANGRRAPTGSPAPPSAPRKPALFRSWF